MEMLQRLMQLCLQELCLMELIVAEILDIAGLFSRAVQEKEKKKKLNQLAYTFIQT